MSKSRNFMLMILIYFSGRLLADNIITFNRAVYTQLRFYKVIGIRMCERVLSFLPDCKASVTY